MADRIIAGLKQDSDTTENRSFHCENGRPDYCGIETTILVLQEGFFSSENGRPDYCGIETEIDAFDVMETIDVKMADRIIAGLKHPFA